MRKLGYIRTSTDKQLVDRQVDQLRAACDRLYVEDGVSAVRQHRPVYERLMRDLKPGDVFVVLAVDRAFRSTRTGLNELHALMQRGVKFVSLTEPFDTRTPVGKAMFTFAATLAELERDMISERTSQGMRAAQRRGKPIGRPRKLTARKIAQARISLGPNGRSSLKQVARRFRVHERTLMRAIRQAQS